MLPTTLSPRTVKVRATAIITARTFFLWTAMWKARNEMMSLIQATCNGGRDGTMTMIRILRKIGLCRGCPATGSWNSKQCGLLGSSYLQYIGNLNLYYA